MEENKKENKKEDSWGEIIKFVLIAAIIVGVFRTFIASPYLVNGTSMDPTFKNGDYLIVDQLSYRFKSPERGDVIIMKYPKDTSKDFIKRVIGLRGERVKIDGGKVTIFNEARPEGFVLDEPYIKFAKSDSSDIQLKNDEYFMMGDNRAGSSDSRIWGPLPEKDVVGRPILRLLPPTDISIKPGKINFDL